MKTNLYLLLAFVGSVTLINAEKDEIRFAITTKCPNGDNLTTEFKSFTPEKIDEIHAYRTFITKINECRQYHSLPFFNRWTKQNETDHIDGNPIEISGTISVPDNISKQQSARLENSLKTIKHNIDENFYYKSYRLPWLTDHFSWLTSLKLLRRYLNSPLQQNVKIGTMDIKKHKE